MSGNNEWVVKETRIKKTYFGNPILVINAVPDTYNRKKYEGDMEFRMSDENWTKLKQAMAECEDTARLVDIYKTEINQVESEQEKEMEQFKEETRKKLNLTEEDVR